MLEFWSLGGGSVSDLGMRPRSFGVAAAMLFATLAAGCAPPLTSPHSSFVMPRTSVAKIEAEIRHSVAYHRALQTARRACARAEPAVAPSDAPGPRPRGPYKALAGTCAALNLRPVAWHGGISNAYRRWVEDRVQELPELSATAASAGGS